MLTQAELFVGAGSAGEAGHAASEAAAQQLQKHAQELPVQEAGSLCGEKPRGGRQGQVCAKLLAFER